MANLDYINGEGELIVYIQTGDDANNFLRDEYCDNCLSPASLWAEKDWAGGIVAYGEYDLNGDLVGFLCPDCKEGCR